MKIPGSVRALHESLQGELKVLAEYTDGMLKLFVSSRRWFYESRIKSLESFALKIETGRVGVASQMEDLFAATIVVQNQSQVEPAVSLLQSELGFGIRYRRPKSPIATEKHPESFQFDDLRTYVCHAQPRGGRDRPELRRVFEIQIKTLLQHAWSAATHDVIYKGPAISWGRERVGFQARAILEQVENAIAALDSYEKALSFPVFRLYEVQNALSDVIVARWAAERLPADTRRLATTVSEVLNALDLSIADLTRALDAAFANGEGSAALDMSPYQAIVTALFDTFPHRFPKLKGQRLRLCVTPELLTMKPGLAVLPAGVLVSIAIP